MHPLRVSTRTVAALSSANSSVLGAPQEEANGAGAVPVSGFPAGFSDRRQTVKQGPLREVRQHGFHVAQLPRQQPPQPERVDHAPDAQRLVEPQRQSGQLHALPVRDQAAEKGLLPACRTKLLLHVAHRERQLGRMDADRADVIAGHAREAAVHLLNQIRTELELSLEPFRAPGPHDRGVKPFP